MGGEWSQRRWVGMVDGGYEDTWMDVRIYETSHQEAHDHYITIYAVQCARYKMTRGNWCEISTCTVADNALRRSNSATDFTPLLGITPGPCPCAVPVPGLRLVVDD